MKIASSQNISWCITESNDAILSRHIYLRYLLTIIYKEGFVKHDKAPTAPKLEGVGFFVDLKYIFYENRYFLPIWQVSVGCFFTKMVKRHMYGPKPFIWAYNQVSKTFRSKVLARTSSSLENRYLEYFGQFDHFRWGVFDRNSQKAHLRTKTFHLSL